MTTSVQSRDNRRGDRRVSSWAELQEQLFEDAWRDNLERCRSTTAFRGAGNEATGLTTRLLDWSYSPYVALHFATL